MLSAPDRKRAAAPKSSSHVTAITARSTIEIYPPTRRRFAGRWRRPSPRSFAQRLFEVLTYESRLSMDDVHEVPAAPLPESQRNLFPLYQINGPTLVFPDGARNAHRNA